MGAGVRVGDGAGVHVYVTVGLAVGVRLGVLVGVTVGGIEVGAIVPVGVIVGGSPCSVNMPDVFQPVPTKIWTS